MSENYKFNQNSACEYFPCHKTDHKEKFNCLFCYCPLFMLGDDCGGNFKTEYGVKDCSSCMLPHGEGGYDFISSRMKEVVDKGSEFINR